MLGGFRESSYRSGHVPWDPGAYDGHLPKILKRHRIPRGPALDIDCGERKSSIRLSRHGFDVLGIDVTPIAIETAQRYALGSIPAWVVVANRIV